MQNYKKMRTYASKTNKTLRYFAKSYFFTTFARFFVRRKTYSTLLNTIMTAFVFPGQGAQFSGMGKDLYDAYPQARTMMQRANDILGFGITDIMFEGSDEDLKQTRVTQPAIFLHSIVSCQLSTVISPNMVAGHSLGEFSALVASGVLGWEDALRLVSERALAMQEACEIQPGSMAAVLGMADEGVAQICNGIDDVVVAANYNCPGQVVISGSLKGVEQACAALKEGGAKRALKLPVGGAFHSPLMQPAKEELEAAIEKATFNKPVCPVYQNVDGAAHECPETIKANLIQQLTASVLWTKEVQNMIAAGATEFVECGPGKALQGMIVKISRDVTVRGL